MQIGDGTSAANTVTQELVARLADLGSWRRRWSTHSAGLNCPNGGWSGARRDDAAAAHPGHTIRRLPALVRARSCENRLHGRRAYSLHCGLIETIGVMAALAVATGLVVRWVIVALVLSPQMD